MGGEVEMVRIDGHVRMHMTLMRNTWVPTCKCASKILAIDLKMLVVHPVLRTGMGHVCTYMYMWAPD